jgi:hypothetical protein
MSVEDSTEKETPQPPEKRTLKWRVTPEQRRDRELTGAGWAWLVATFWANYYLDLSEETLALTLGVIPITINIIRAARGFKVHYLSLAFGLISLVHGVTHFLEIPFPLWYVLGTAVVLYGIAKLLLKDKIR